MDFAKAVIQHRCGVGALWLVLIPVGLLGARALSGRMVAVTRLEGSESAQVEDLLSERFGSSTAHSLLLVARGLAEADGASGDGLLAQLTNQLAGVPGVRSVTSPLSTPDSLLRGREPGSAILIVGIDARLAPGDSIVGRLRDVTEATSRQLRSSAPDATLHWTGGAALSADLRQTSASHSRRAELRALPVLLAVLLVAFRSVVAALVPLVLGALTIALGLGVALLIGWFGTPSTLLGNVASILGLALGIDYSLLMVTRFRETLSRGATPEQASMEAARTAGHIIVLSGATVALGFAALLLVPIPEIRSVGLGGVGVAAVAVALATTLLPAVLSWLGKKIDGGRLGRQPHAAPARMWYRLGRVVTHHPFRVLLLGAVPLVLLSLPALRLSSATPHEDWLPERMESARAFDDLTEIGRSGLASVMPVIVELPRRGRSEAPEWEGVALLSEALANDPRVAEVRSVPTIAAAVGLPVELFLQLAPDALLRHYLSLDGALARVDVVPAPDVPATGLAALVRFIRERGPEDVPPLSTPQRVGGMAAFQADFEAAVERAFPRVALSVIASILLALSLGFRSLLVPIKATFLNLLTVGAAFGVLVLVFQDGHGSGLFGLSGPLSGVFPGVPVLAFCIVFGLSMDYEVFLVGRVAEIRRTNPRGSEKDAIIEGLARTGRVISFAATLMIVVFASFAFGEYLPAALLGFTLAIAVLADVTLVRLAVGPALLAIAGRWNWWPGRPSRDEVVAGCSEESTY